MHTDPPSDYSHLFDLTGSSVLVLGVGGIGAAVARGLQAQGASVGCADRDIQTVETALAGLNEASTGGTGHTGHVLDVTDSAAVADLAGSLTGLDALVLTAATNVRKRLLDYTEADFDRVVGLNLRGSFNVLRHFGREMTSRGHGSIVLFSSIRSEVVEPGQSMYAATKAGVNQLVKTAAAEFGGLGVRVNAVAPGVVDTPLADQIRTDDEWYTAYATKGALGRWAQPQELAGAVVYLVSSASTFVTGTVLHVDGGWTAMDGRFTPPL